MGTMEMSGGRSERQEDTHEERVDYSCNACTDFSVIVVDKGSI